MDDTIKIGLSASPSNSNRVGSSVTNVGNVLLKQVQSGLGIPKTENVGSDFAGRLCSKDYEMVIRLYRLFILQALFIKRTFVQ